MQEVSWSALAGKTFLGIQLSKIISIGTSIELGGLIGGAVGGLFLVKLSTMKQWIRVSYPVHYPYGLSIYLKNFFNNSIIYVKEGVWLIIRQR